MRRYSKKPLHRILNNIFGYKASSMRVVYIFVCMTYLAAASSAHGYIYDAGDSRSIDTYQVARWVPPTDANMLIPTVFHGTVEHMHANQLGTYRAVVNVHQVSESQPL